MRKITLFLLSSVLFASCAPEMRRSLVPSRERVITNGELSPHPIFLRKQQQTCTSTSFRGTQLDLELNLLLQGTHLRVTKNFDGMLDGVLLRNPGHQVIADTIYGIALDLDA